LIQIGREGLIIDDARFAELRAQFRTVRHVLLPRLLEPSVLDFLQRRIESGSWQTRVHDAIGEEQILDDPSAISLLNFIVNDRKFRELVEYITGCGPLRRFHGRIYRMIPRVGHYDLDS
jgi:hypothetical protein